MKEKNILFKNIHESLEVRVTHLLGLLTQDEKISLLSTSQSAIPRLGIKEYQVGGEAAHGVVDRKGGKTTVFPQPIGLSCTWNRELMKKVGSVIGDEARIFYEQNQQKTGLTLWAPTIDMERDPRWGRTEEAYGEDPYLTGQLATELIKGMQGEDPFYIKLVAAPKHFYGNNNEYGRERISNSIDPRNRYEYYLKAFEPAFKEGKALSMMTAYNGVNGIPAMQIREIKEIVKDQWKMDGFVVCDGGALTLNVEEYGYYSSYAEALADALKKGIDCFVDEKERVEEAAREALKQQLITEEELTKAIGNMLKVRFRLGHFDEDTSKNPYSEVDKNKLCSREHAELALESTNESIVLLKNEQNKLPLKKEKLKKIAVIGPTADIVYRDWYTGYSPYQITPLMGIKHQSANQQIQFVKGNDKIVLKSLDTNGYMTLGEDDELVFAADAIGEKEIFELEEWGWNGNLLKNQANQRYICQNEQDARFKASSQEVFNWFIREKMGFHTVNEKQETYHLSTWQGEPLNIDDGQRLTTASQPGTFQKQILSSGIEEAVQAAKESDVAIVCLGNNPMLNGRETEDRPDIILPKRQQKLLEEVYKVNKNVVLVLISSYPMAINWAEQHIPAILYSSHGSQMLGESIASILFGDIVPSGKLSMTWYKSVRQLPTIFDYDIIRSKRTYQYFDEEVLYPFGYGLSYAICQYDRLQLDKTTLTKDETVSINVEVENLTNELAYEVVQLYATVKGSAVPRPRKQLVDFIKIKLQPYEKRKVSLSVTADQLMIWNVNEDRYTLETASCLLSVGPSSEDIKLTESLQIQGQDLHQRSLREVTKAENYNDYDGVYLDKGENGLNCVTNRANGWIAFENVEMFAEKLCVELRVTTDGIPGKVKLKIDQLNHSSIIEKEFTVQYPGEWVDVQLPFTANQDLHDLFILMEGPVAINTLQLKEIDGPDREKWKRTSLRKKYGLGVLDMIV
ncbi:glycoside hydrolase family 3 C-terminal domain-containing protein [Lederbergia galactosidilytica]|uniref:glycoside hydrolase family 3 C-terminal domain-containing protein n=1 Tax=Lederbergia galactosidilytica TaxID=217031 RepID=UPI0007DB0758|nr:glycoside hydrolase family 3 C-terminal domain-containing protein [Lederbergia galactosidilytica]